MPPSGKQLSSGTGYTAPNALSGNENHSSSWQAQQQRGLRSRAFSGSASLSSAAGVRPLASGGTLFHH